MTELHAAIRARDWVATEALLEAGAEPNRKDSLGVPPLSLAAGLGSPQAVKLMLSAGADPLLLDTRMGASALHKAAQSGVVHAAELLLDHGGFVDQQAPTHGHTPLIDASWHKRAPMVSFLLERGADPEIHAHGGYDAATLLSVDEVLPEIRTAIAAERDRRAGAGKARLRVAAARRSRSGDGTRVRL